MFHRVRDRVVGSFWMLPAAMTLAGGLVAALLTWADSALWSTGVEFGFAGGPDAARSLLSVIASSTLTLAGLTFSVTLVVLTLASSQYSPRILRTFLTDQRAKLTLGCSSAPTSTRGWRCVPCGPVTTRSGGRCFVPGVTLTVAFLVALVAIGVFALFIDHVVQSIRVENIIERIAADTRKVIDRVYPVERDHGPAFATATPDGSVSGADLPDGDATPRRSHEVAAPYPGVISSIDLSSMVKRARDADAFVLRALIVAVNVTTTAVTLADGTTVTAALAQRDALGRRIRLVTDAADRAANKLARFGRAEIREVATLDVAALRAEADQLAAQRRALHAELQRVNWTTELAVAL